VLRLAIRVRGQDAELVLAELLELAPSGVEEVQVAPDVVEYAVYGPPGELPTLPDLTAAAGGALIEVSTRELPDDWDQRWRAFHRPLVLAGRLTVRPPWEPAGDTPIDIVIDPAQAFGTGAHATTQLCLELMLELAAAEAPGGALLDVGTGSGVLAIAGAMLGFEPVLALDNDRESVRAAADNARANDVDVEVRRFELTSDPPPGLGAQAGSPSAPRVLTANLLRPLLLELASRLGRAPAHLIAGGLLAPEADEVAHAFARLGLAERSRRHGGEWAALWLTAG
jgi:ribosomal protein L11 methyltransferase